MKAYTITDFHTRYGPWAFVAGASVGLGAEFAMQLAAKGLNLVLLARRKELVEALGTRLINDYAIEVRTLHLDLASDTLADEVTTVISDIEIGLLVYNAATSVIGPFFERDLHNHLNEIAVNCRAPLVLSHLLGQRMLMRQHGGIVLMSSLSSAQGSALLANYGATKAYSRLLAEGLWEELRLQGVDVLACCPAAVNTPNYLTSAPDRSRRVSASAMAPYAVVAEAFAALGKRPLIIPGRGNRLAHFVMQRLLPHRTAITLMGRVMRAMYAR